MIRAKKPKIKAEGVGKRYQDLLEIDRWVSECMKRFKKYRESKDLRPKGFVAPPHFGS